MSPGAGRGQIRRKCGANAPADGMERGTNPIAGRRIHRGRGRGRGRGRAAGPDRDRSQDLSYPILYIV